MQYSFPARWTTFHGWHHTGECFFPFLRRPAPSAVSFLSWSQLVWYIQCTGPFINNGLYKLWAWFWIRFSIWRIALSNWYGKKYVEYRVMNGWRFCLRWATFCLTNEFMTWRFLVLVSLSSSLACNLQIPVFFSWSAVLQRHHALALIYILFRVGCSFCFI